MGPANKQWIRSRMAAIKKASGIAFSEEIFLSILICLIAKNKHLVLHTFPEAIPELKSVVEQHCAVVFGLTTATIVCHGQQTKTDIIAAITGRHADMATHANGGVSVPYPSHSAYASTATGAPHHNHHHPHNSSSYYSQHPLAPSSGGGGGGGTSGHYYHYSNPGEDYTQRSAKMRFERSRRSVATNYSEASELSQRVTEYQTTAGMAGAVPVAVSPSITSVKTATDHDARHMGYEDPGNMQQRGSHYQEVSDYGSRIGDDVGSTTTTTLRKSDSRAKGTGVGRTGATSGAHTYSQDGIAMETLGTNQYLQAPNGSTVPGGSNSGAGGGGHMAGASGSSHAGKGNGSIHSSSHAPVTPVDFTFPRRRHESLSIQGGYTGHQAGGGGGPSGVTYGGRKIAQAIILDGLEHASQEVYAVLLEMIINKGINDRNRYELPDLIIIAIFNSQNVPDTIPKQLLDYFAINCSYLYSIPQPRVPPPIKKHAHFRRTDWDELSKRMKAVTVSNDMTRYIRDVIVAVRTHEAVHGGLTSRAALDLELIMKTLAAVFQTTFVTPELLVTAAEKVFSHRLELKSRRRKKLMMMMANQNNHPGDTFSSSSSSSMKGPTVPVAASGAEGRDSSLRSGVVQRGVAATASLGGSSRRQQQQEHHDGAADTETDDAASFVQLSDSDDTSSDHHPYSRQHHQQQQQQQQQHSQSGSRHPRSNYSAHQNSPLIEDGSFIDEYEKTAADVVKDVLRTVYPPI
ncbi:hypothetical protein BGZ94_006863 [Podila epigama]|nr:hypothetical protein BGZ94_006863 [Podila epigama]